MLDELNYIPPYIELRYAKKYEKTLLRLAKFIQKDMYKQFDTKEFKHSIREWDFFCGITINAVRKGKKELVGMI